MKKFYFLWVFLFLTSINLSLSAQSYVPLQVTGFSDDLIANGSQDVVGSTTHGFDWDGSGGANYYQSGYMLNSITGCCGLPVSGLINSSGTPGVVYQLADYTGNNALLLINLNQSGTLTFINPGVFDHISICAASAGTPHVPTTFTAQLNFSDSSNTTYSFSVPDWFETNPYPTAIAGIGRAFRVTNTFQNVTDNPKMFDCVIVLDSTDKTKILTSITCTKTVSNDRTGIFAICGITAGGTPPAVVSNAATAVTRVGFNANWNSTATATAYYIDVSTTNDFSHMVGIYNNYNVGNLTTFNITELSPGTKYYYRVRGANSYGQGPNSNLITVTTTQGAGIGEKNAGNVTIYPVPNDGHFNIEISSSSEITYKLEVYNNLGVKINSDHIITASGNIVTSLDLRPLPSGFYTLILLNANNQVIREIPVINSTLVH